jgi:hypothetical protein
MSIHGIFAWGDFPLTYPTPILISTQIPLPRSWEKAARVASRRFSAAAHQRRVASTVWEDRREKGILPELQGVPFGALERRGTS